MANPLLFKSLAGVGGVAAVTGAAIGIPKLLAEKEQSISDLIKTKNPEKRLISATAVGDGAWKKAWQAYRTANKSALVSEDTFRLSDWSGVISGEIKDTDDAKQTFLDACFVNSKKKVLSNSQLYKDVLNYCTRDTTISDLVTDSKKTVLSKEIQKSDPKWKAAWERYRLANKDLGTDTWAASGFSSAKDNADQDALEGFRDQCESKLSSSSIHDKNLLEQVKSWCTVEGNF
ncbi:hypothetical protein MHC_04635 [Mycoplasma haemocanis str. Illinois]|uniref:Uncharacterized protein n=1 Tax=Mycoplasma haemocanis (strain Illinois) TaxID=1111676 RepID=H6N811_MYCHN|nr:hypothetical protein [Mycoplasma haemocanis]AEW45783.1 hypothetical protein MHC_04635 [Mycoplasma haemocanis str. Illinois]